MPQATTKKSYKDTLNLPKTDFPMRANLAQNEPISQKQWAQSKLYEKAVAARRNGKPFVFHDGPPYANGSIHVGHLLNKVLKDLVVRSRLLMGNHCPYVPGWDCHGLPIEHKVMTELVESGKAEKINSLDDDTRRMVIRRECAKYAEKFVKLQAGQMQRLLTLADYENPYLTMNPRYERAVLEVFAELIEQGVVYRALKPVHWSIANQTALAEAELEYEDRTDLSIYVDFEAADREAVARAFGVELDETPSFMIWTTTPWTLPANLAIAVHERFRYALVRVDGNVTVIARELVQRVTEAANAESVEVLAETDGATLVGLRYRHPFCSCGGAGVGGTGVPPVGSAPYCVVSADYVTLEDGTGLVHTAPGHGAEDYATGKVQGLDIYCPVQDDGTFDDTVPDWLRGLSVWDANEKITQHLRDSGHLFYSHEFTHSYPHDWRSKTPVIFRSTEQWFIAVDAPLAKAHGLQSVGVTNENQTLRTLALRATNSEIAFIPEWGRNRMRGMLESRPDWCISRQRAWGLPIPAFRLPSGEIFMTAASVRAVAQVVGEKGSDAWFTDSPDQLLAQYNAQSDRDAPPCLQASKPSSLSKTYDIFDVWFESGSSWNAVMRERGLGYPVDLYLEGSDQHRGWFQLSLLPALGVTGASPFRSVLTHGFMVDKDGRKMSKSGGNALDVDELLKHHGADVCRWWVSSLAFENDIKVDPSFFDLAGESYRKVRNTVRFLLSNLYDFNPGSDGGKNGGTGVSPVRTGMCIDLKSLSPTSIDAYIVSEGRKLESEVMRAYETYEFRRANLAIYDFCNETLSAFYCAAVKDRLYCDAPDSPRRRATQAVMWTLLEVLCRLLAPILPHTADEAYRDLWKDRAKCVHLETRAQAPDIAADPDWPAALAAREHALKALETAKQRGVENPLDAEVVLPDAKGVLRKFAADFADMLGVSRVRFEYHDAPRRVSIEEGVTPPEELRDAERRGTILINDLRDEPRCERSWKRDGTVKKRSDGGMLSDRDARAIGME